MLTRERVLTLLRENANYLTAEFGVRRVGLFGSVARDQDSEQSDIDLVVDFERPIGFRFIELAEYLEGLLGREVDILTPTGVQSIRHESVMRNITESVVYVYRHQLRYRLANRR